MCIRDRSRTVAGLMMLLLLRNRDNPIFLERLFHPEWNGGIQMCIRDSCKPCESFWTDSQLRDGKCPDCGGPVYEAEEEAYFLFLIHI